MGFFTRLRNDRIALSYIVLVVIAALSIGALAAALTIKQGDLSRVQHRQALLNARQSQLIVENARGVKSQCALTADLRDRAVTDQKALDRSKKLFREQPNLFPTVPRALIAQGFADQQRRINGTRRTYRILAANLGNACDKK